ncbi:hypothetical protein [Butyrivibrio sp. JL13D10]|uniref:hypothetical protein n=1 Tax=Butyrivibrio sp. JL13D10 TaxID=3236815 RepID=UPI0038B69C05
MKKRHVGIFLSVAVAATMLQTLTGCADVESDTDMILGMDNTESGDVEIIENEDTPLEDVVPEVEEQASEAQENADLTSDTQEENEQTSEAEKNSADTTEDVHVEDEDRETVDLYIGKVASAANADPKDVRYHLVGDFDEDGKTEGFFYVGKEADLDFGACDGTIWFVNENGCKKLHDDFEFGLKGDNIFSVLNCTNKKFVAFDDVYVTSRVTNLYYVDGDECLESKVSRMGHAEIDKNTGDLIVTFDGYDNYCDYEADSEEPMWTGHTWKPYCYYYDENSCDFNLYGAKQITAEELKEICGIDAVAELESNGYEVTEIIKCDNGMVYVNYKQTTENADGSKSICYNNSVYDSRIGDFVDVWGDGQKGLLESNYGGTFTFPGINE